MKKYLWETPKNFTWGGFKRTKPENLKEHLILRENITTSRGEYGLWLGFLIEGEERFVEFGCNEAMEEVFRAWLLKYVGENYPEALDHLKSRTDFDFLSFEDWKEYEAARRFYSDSENTEAKKIYPPEIYGDLYLTIADDWADSFEAQDDTTLDAYAYAHIADIKAAIIEEYYDEE